MANPEHEEVLDYFDKLSVCLYRTGISLFALSLFMLAVIQLNWDGPWASYSRVVLITLCVSAALAAANLHIYSKHIRAVISWSAWVGIVLMLSDPDLKRIWLSLGFLFVTFSGIALKESFCFKVVGLKLVPLLLAVATLSLCLNQRVITAVTLAICALVMGYLAWAKWRMPLHFDIGIKANYQI